MLFSAPALAWSGCCGATTLRLCAKIFAHPGAAQANQRRRLCRVQRSAVAAFALTSTINYYRAVVRENPFLLKRRVSPVEAETLLIWGTGRRTCKS